MKKSFLIIGLGRFGSSVAKTLSKLNHDVICLDVNEDTVRDVLDYVDHSVIGDSTKMATLKELGASSIDHAVVAIGNNLEASILTTLNLKNLGVKQITVRSDSVDYKEMYKKLGATEVIVPEEASAVSLARQICNNSILDYYSVDSDYALVKLLVSSEFKERTLIDMNLRNLFDVNIVGIFHDGQFYIPKGTDYIRPSDILVLVGTEEKIKKVANVVAKD